MTTKTEVFLVCDLCYSEAEVETATVALDKRKVEIELCSRCRAKTEKAMTKVLGIGRRPGSKIPTAPRKRQV